MSWDIYLGATPSQRVDTHAMTAPPHAETELLPDVTDTLEA